MPYLNLSSTNLAQGLLDAGMTAGQTTLVLQSGQGGLFPTTFPFRVLIQNFDSQGRATKNEIATVTNRVSDTFTITRASEAVPASYSATTQTTTAFAFDSGDSVTLVLTAGQQKDVQDQLATRLGAEGGNLTGQLEFAKAANLASAATVNLGAATGNYVHITGTTTITSLGSTAQAGTQMEVVFDGILTLTHNATSLILPTAANITTAAGDTATFVCESTGNWKCAMYARASGQPLVAPTIPDIHGRQLFTASGTFNVPTGVSTVYVSMCGGGGGGGGYRGAGGGGAASVFHQSQAVTPGAAITVTIGAAGAAGGAPSPTATAGGNSSFGAFITTNGGGFGAYASGAGGAAGGAGGTPGQIGNGNEGAGKGGDGGSCHFGRGGSAEYRASATNGGTSQAGSGFGAGGAGGPWNGSGMAGSPGMCLVEW